MEATPIEVKRVSGVWVVVFSIVYALNVININRGLDGSSQVFLCIVQGMLTGVVVFSKKLYVIGTSTLAAEVAGTLYSWSAGFLVDAFVFVSIALNVIAFIIFTLFRKMFQDDGPTMNVYIKNMNKWLRLAIQGVASGCIAILVASILSLFVQNPVLPLFTYLSLILTVVVLQVIFCLAYKIPVDVYTPALAHHVEEDADHSIMITIGNLTTYLCSRCSGMILGIATAFYLFQTMGLAIPSITALLMDIFIPMPIFIDWGTQRLGLRKSTTTSRMITGALTGFGFFLLTFSILEYPVASGLILCAYFVVFFLIFFLSFRRGY